MPRKPSKPTCGHSDRKVAGRGKCSKCYEDYRRDSKRAYKKGTKYQSYLKTPRYIAVNRYRVGLHRGVILKCELPSIIHSTYEMAIEFYSKCPVEMIVDHIIPLNHPNVCGLHVPWNLQYLTEVENYMKGNSNDGTYSNDSWRYIRIKCLETQVLFRTAQEAADTYNLDSSSLLKVLKGKYRKTKGYTFTYVTLDDL